MIRRYGIGLLAMMVLSLWTLPAPAQVALSWKLKKGDQFYLKSVSHAKQSLKGLGKEAKQDDVTITTVLGFTVEDKTAEGGMVLKETIESVSFKSGTNAPVFDDKIQDASFTITLGPKFEVLKFEGYDKLIDKLAGEDLNARKRLQTLVSQEMLKTTVREALAFLPERKVKAGDTWEQPAADAAFGPLGSLKVTRLYKYEGKDEVGGKAVEKISFVTSVEFKPTRADDSLPFHVASGDVKAEDAKGEIFFDAATGRLVKSEEQMVLHGKHSITVVGAPPTETEIERDLKTSVILLNEKPARK